MAALLANFAERARPGYLIAEISASMLWKEHAVRTLRSRLQSGLPAVNALIVAVMSVMGNPSRGRRQSVPDDSIEARLTIVFAALGRVVTVAIALFAGQPGVESQVGGGPQVKPRSSAVRRLEVSAIEVGAHLIQALLAEGVLGVLPRLSAAPEESVGEAMQDGSSMPIAGVGGVACQAERCVWDVRPVADATALSQRPLKRVCGARLVTF